MVSLIAATASVMAACTTTLTKLAFIWMILTGLCQFLLGLHIHLLVDSSQYKFISGTLVRAKSTGHCAIPAY